MEEKSLKNRLSKQVNASSLGLFRFFFGLFMIFEMLYYFSIDFIEKAYFAPSLLFPYDFLEFVQPLPEPIMNAILGIMLISAIFIALGFYHRIAATIFFIGNTYFLLLDKGIYNNHLYLFSLLAFLLILTSASNAFSIKNKFSLNKNTFSIPNWQLWLLRFQIVIVYFFGGIAKLNPDWLIRHEPMRTVLNNFGYSDPANGLVTLMAYGSLFIDLGLGFLLLFKKTRWFAAIFLLIFHVSNAILFNDIGIFPYLMIASTVLFFDGEEIVRFFKRKSKAQTKSQPQTNKKGLKKLSKKEKKKREKETQSPALEETIVENPVTIGRKTPAFVFPIVIAFVIFQVLFPLRHWVLPNNVDWTNIAQNFSWRMKIQTRKAIETEFFVVDWDQQMKFPVDVGTYINTMQRSKMTMDPRMGLRFAEYIAEEAKTTRGIANPEIRAKMKVNYNGRGPFDVFDFEKDLLKADYSPFKKADWILPIE